MVKDQDPDQEGRETEEVKVRAIGKGAGRKKGGKKGNCK